MGFRELLRSWRWVFSCNVMSSSILFPFNCQIRKYISTTRCLIYKVPCTNSRMHKRGMMNKNKLIRIVFNSHSLFNKNRLCDGRLLTLRYFMIFLSSFSFSLLLCFDLLKASSNCLWFFGVFFGVTTLTHSERPFKHT